MPFVRYARDRRGYETLYVMHAFEGAEGGRDARPGRPRVLYACRTVPYAKFGRTTLDDSVQRRLETAYPSLNFDWPKLLKEAAQSAPRPERTEQQQRQDRKQRGARKGGGRESREPRGSKVPRVPEVPKVQFQVPEVQEVQEVQPVQEIEPGPDDVLELEAPEPLEPITELIEWNPGTEPVEPLEPLEPLEPMVPQVPEEIPPLMVDPAWPVVDVAGTERSLILRARFIELASKILSRVSDPARRQRLFREAARLNPEGWRTTEEARAGLDAFESIHNRVSEQLRQQPPV